MNEHAPLCTVALGWIGWQAAEPWDHSTLPARCLHPRWHRHHDCAICTPLPASAGQRAHALRF
jgi:hypothetical protein